MVQNNYFSNVAQRHQKLDTPEKLGVLFRQGGGSSLGKAGIWGGDAERAKIKKVVICKVFLAYPSGC